MVRAVRVHDYSLELTMYPSFTYTLYKVEDSVYTKVFGVNIGFKMWQDKNLLYYNGDYEFLELASGLWYDPYSKASKIPRSYRSRVGRLLDVYSKVRLAINPYDTIHMFISIFLSRRTDFHVNVVRWCKKIFQTIDTYGVRSVDVKSIGGNYQLLQLSKVISLGFLDNLEDLKVKPNPWIFRSKMLKIPYVGPKTVHAYILFTSKHSQFAPTDVHMLRINKLLGIVDANETPNSKYCIRYTCFDCPLLQKCVTGSLITCYDELAGWIQTIAYVHDSLYCLKSRCFECPLRSECYKP